VCRLVQGRKGFGGYKRRKERKGRREGGKYICMCFGQCRCEKRRVFFMRFSVCFGVGQQECMVKVTCVLDVKWVR
jgi:hypothetical protein